MPAKNIAIIGGGPAGLRAAEIAAAAGATVTLYDARRSVGRKFLLAGKSGLNLTNSAPPDTFPARYTGHELPAAFFAKCLAAFDSTALREWAASLGIETIATSSGKVFPVTMKAAPLLRRWVARLRELGVRFAMNHRWTGLTHGTPLLLHFATPGGPATAAHDRGILALGGGSWPATGSDGGWVPILEKSGITIRPLTSSNCGWECDWTPETRARVEGRPLQNIRVTAGPTTVSGEIMLTRYGIEGTLIYHLGRILRQMPEPAIHIDFKPTFDIAQLTRKMESVRRAFLREAPQRWRLPDAACALIEQFHGQPDSAAALAAIAKNCRIPLTRPRPLAEAISTAGGIAWSELDDTLMLKKLPGIHSAGEMLDWDAPTGGYLLQACFATATLAAISAAAH